MLNHHSVHFKYLISLFVSYTLVQLRKVSMWFSFVTLTVFHLLQSWRKPVLGGGLEDEGQSAAWRGSKEKLPQELRCMLVGLFKALTCTSLILPVITGYHQ